MPHIVGSTLLVVMTLATAVGAAGAPQLTALTPSRQRVGEIVTLRGAGFGVYTPGVSKVVFATADVSIEAGTPYVWRDEFIQVRVPAGRRIGGVNVPLPHVPLSVWVIGSGSPSAPVPFQVVISPEPGLPPLAERTAIVDHRDVSAFLGDASLNLARTKDADFADVDGDGWIDLVDNNSNNEFNVTHSVLRRNVMGQRFEAIALEPINADDTGVFATTVLPDGDYPGDANTYDADFVDLDNDGLPEYVQTASYGLGSRIRVLVNNHEGVPGRFLERSIEWTGGGSLSNCPDDLAHTDVNNDGWVDVAASLRRCNNGGTSTVEIYLNQKGSTFGPPIVLLAPASQSTHDVFFLDANGDGYHDVLMVNESGEQVELLLHDGQATPGFTVGQSFAVNAFSGLAADLDADGLDDFVLAGDSFARVYHNDPERPGTFTSSSLAGADALHYDVELADVDLDGSIDVTVAAITRVGNNTIDIWLNNGDATFVHATPGGAIPMLPGIADYQRLSADLFDFDRDGDLDLYISGADGQDVGSGQGFGRVPNQFFENVLTCPGDIDGNHVVAFGDVLAVLSLWGPCEACAADLDGNGVITFADLLSVLANWGPCRG